MSTKTLAPRWSKVRRKADELTKPYSAPPIPVLEIAEQKGVHVIFADFGEHSSTVAGFCDFEESVLFVNSKDIVPRQNFTMAHELGHWILHRDIYLEEPDTYPFLPRFQSVEDPDPLEKEANYFAANLLVPERLLRPVLRSSSSALANAFAVSRTMMEYRLKNARR